MISVKFAGFFIQEHLLRLKVVKRIWLAVKYLCAHLKGEVYERNKKKTKN